jgi:hypothetical protein
MIDLSKLTLKKEVIDRLGDNQMDRLAGRGNFCDGAGNAYTAGSCTGTSPTSTLCSCSNTCVSSGCTGPGTTCLY